MIEFPLSPMFSSAFLKLLALSSKTTQGTFFPPLFLSITNINSRCVHHGQVSGKKSSECVKNKMVWKKHKCYIFEEQHHVFEMGKALQLEDLGSDPASSTY